jgi:8-oxo-dGTP diphosphatase
MAVDHPILSESLSKRPGRKGVVAVVHQQGRFLTIRRSAFVTAPNLLCFPGGGIEDGELPHEALIREMQEELGLLVIPMVELWKNRTPWGTHLTWWETRLPTEFTFAPDEREVAEVLWMTERDLLSRADVLVSVSQFFEALRIGRFSLTEDE